MSDLVKRTLSIFPVDSGAATHVEVPVEQLERMAGKVNPTQPRLQSPTDHARLRNSKPTAQLKTASKRSCGIM